MNSTERLGFPTSVRPELVEGFRCLWFDKLTTNGLRDYLQ
jgi:hypothetical protein